MDVSKFPEIAKAVGGMKAGHKYFKREPKPGGGYTYYYTKEQYEKERGVKPTEKPEKKPIGKPTEKKVGKMQEAKEALKKHGKVRLDPDGRHIWIEAPPLKSEKMAGKIVESDRIAKKMRESLGAAGIEIEYMGGRGSNEILIELKESESGKAERIRASKERVEAIGERTEKEHGPAAKKSKVDDRGALQALFDATPGPKNVDKFMREERSHRVDEATKLAHTVLGHKTDEGAAQAIKDMGGDVTGKVTARRALNIAKKMRQGVKKSFDTSQFPEIAKAVGAQRGGKYLKRVPKPGGGYKYEYAEGEKGRPGLQADLIRNLSKMSRKKRAKILKKMSPQRRAHIKERLLKYQTTKPEERAKLA